MNIKKCLRHFVSAIALFALAPLGVGQATSYNFSYKFDSTNTVTGTFDGIASGNLIGSINNSSISVKLNGIDLGTPGSFVSAGYDGNPATHLPNTWTGSAQVSIDGTASNFGFFTPSLSGFNAYFYIIPWCNGNCLGDNGTGVQTLTNGTTVTYLFNGNYNSANWNVSAVPEPETYAMLLAGLGLMGFMARRRKQAA